MHLVNTLEGQVDVVTTPGINKENARLRIFRGVTNPKLKITPDMEVGHLYHCNNDVDELSVIGQLVGLRHAWMQNRLRGLAHYDLWGAPLERAKKLFKIVTVEEVYQDIERLSEGVREYRESMEHEAAAQSRESNMVLTNIGFVSFVSKTKGRSRGKGRPRRLPGQSRVRKEWKEIELYRYCGSGWHTERHFPFDTVFTEVTEHDKSIGGDVGDDLKMYVKGHCDRKGGKIKGGLGVISVGI